MKELNEEDLNERLNDEEDLMMELTEEEMKREGGACMGDRNIKGGYDYISTKQQRGYYKIDNMNAYHYILDGWNIETRGRRITR